MHCTHRFVTSNQLDLHVAISGPATGELVILLHGFPEFWYGWRHQIPALAKAGYHIWAPDQRGYNISHKPTGIQAYALDHLAADVLALMDAAGAAKAHLVGHDWGAAVGWHVATIQPERVQSFVAINVPHGAVMRRHLVHLDVRQIMRSWYIFAFQVPVIPERFLSMNHYRFLVDQLTKTARPGTWTQEDLALYREAWAQPMAMQAMINWYRAAMRHAVRYPSALHIEVAVLVLWGMQDSFLDAAMGQESVALCRRQGVWKPVPQATHWVHLEEPSLVNAALADWLAGHAMT